VDLPGARGWGVGYKQGRFELWDAAELNIRLTATLPTASPIKLILPDHRNERVFLFQENHQLSELNLSTGQSQMILPLTQDVVSGFVTPDQERLLLHFGYGRWESLNLKARRFEPYDCPSTLPSGFAIHPEGTGFAVAVERNQVWIWDRAGRQVLARGYSEFPGTALAFSPDGQDLAIASRDGLIDIWDWASYQHRHRIHTPEMGLERLVYSPTGRSLFSQHQHGYVLQWDTVRAHPVPGMTLLPRIQKWGNDVGLTSFSGDGRTQLRIIQPPMREGLSPGNGSPPSIRWEARDLRTSQQLWSKPLPPTEVLAVALDQKAQRAATLQADQTLTLWDLSRGGPLQSWPHAAGQDARLALNPAGDRILCNRSQGGLAVYELGQAQPIATLAETNLNSSCFCFTPDGQTAHVVTYQQMLLEWNFLGPTPSLKLLGTDIHAYLIVHHPTERDLLIVGHDGTLSSWDRDLEQIRVSVRQEALSPQEVAFAWEDRQILVQSGMYTHRFGLQPTMPQQFIRYPTGTRPTGVRASPDGDRVWVRLAPSQNWPGSKELPRHAAWTPETGQWELNPPWELPETDWRVEVRLPNGYFANIQNHRDDLMWIDPGRAEAFRDYEHQKYEKSLDPHPRWHWERALAAWQNQRGYAAWFHLQRAEAAWPPDEMTRSLRAKLLEDFGPPPAQRPAVRRP